MPFSIWPALIVFALIMAVAWASVQWIAPLRHEVTIDQNNPRLLVQLEGLRGLLAIAVFLHHAVLVCFVLPVKGQWVAPPSNFYSQLADGPVLMFFFLTGFLFWSKLLRQPAFQKSTFFLGRLKRLGPVYGFAMTWLFLLVAWRTHFHVHVAPARLGFECLQWLLFSWGGRPDVNGLPNTWWLIAGTPWTLAFEWQFYLILPFLGWFARQPYRIILLIAICWCLSMVSLHLGAPARGSLESGIVGRLRSFAGHMTYSFSVGMLIAVIRSRWDWPAVYAKSSLASILGVCALLAYLLRHPPGFFDPFASLVLGLIFLCIVYGNVFWGLLRSRAVLLLGKCSYSLYLCHGLVLSSGSILYHQHSPSRVMTPLEGWSFIALISIVVFGVSVLCHLLIEEPPLRKSDRSTNHLSMANSPIATGS